MSIIRLNENKLRTVVFIATGLFLFMSALFFLPIGIPHKVTLPVATLFVASLWLCPWEMTLALLFSALGDYFGSCNHFIAQMGFFAAGHAWLIFYFTRRYFKKIEPDRRLTAKAKGYMTMIIICALALLAVVFTRIVPCTPEGSIRIGVCIYACLICSMLVIAMLQRSSIFALGAILFVFSDFILAWNKFVEPVPHSSLLILATYFLAQWLLFIRSTSFRVAPEMRILRF